MEGGNKKNRQTDFTANLSNKNEFKVYKKLELIEKVNINLLNKTIISN